MNSWMNQEWHPRVGRNKPAPMHKQYFRTMDRGILAPSYAPARQWDQPSLFGLTRGHPIKWQPFSALGDCNSNCRRGRQFQGMRAVAQYTAPDRLKVHGPGMDVSESFQAHWWICPFATHSRWLECQEDWIQELPGDFWAHEITHGQVHHSLELMIS